jgi:uncharacterized protein YbcC (UPF0753/DUF2309 family)
MTKGVFLDRRSFLQSYDAALDDDGSILRSILNAVIPVCGGINLEYYYSRVDSEVFGAGTKLPQNVVGLFGVMTGLEGDLRTGLPAQMTEIHDPQRLLMLIEQEPTKVEAIVNSSEMMREWVGKGWIHLMCLPPNEDNFYLYRDMCFERLDIPVHAPQTETSSLAAARKSSNNIKPLLISEVGV